MRYVSMAATKHAIIGSAGVSEWRGSLKHRAASNLWLLFTTRLIYDSSLTLSAGLRGL